MKQGDDLITTWTRAQQKLWESLAAALSNSRSAEGQEVVKAAHRGGLAAWEAAVNQSLRAQEVWLEQWFRNAGMTNPELARAGEQLQEIMRCWVSTQTQLWDNWFDLLRSYSSAAEQGAEEARAMAESLPMPPPMAAPAVVAQQPEAPPANEPPAAASDTAEPEPEPEPESEVEKQAAEPVAETPPMDDLKAIKGIGPKLEEKLNKLGFHSYRQLAQLDAEGIQRIEAAMRFPGRLYREDWVGQARRAHQEKYGEELK